MSMTVEECTTAVQELHNDRAGVIFTDNMIENWLMLASMDIAAKTLCVQQKTPVYLPTNDLSTELNQLADVVLSGPPRIVASRNVYFKVWPVKSGSETPSTNPSGWKSYNDATLSGSPIRIGFRHGGYLYWLKGYPNISIASGETADSLQDITYPVVDDTITGTPSVFRILTGGAYYYFKAYRIAGHEVSDESVRFLIDSENVKVLSVHRTTDAGTPAGLFRIHPRFAGHIAAAALPPRYWYDFAHQISIMPVSDIGMTLDIITAGNAADLTELPDGVQPLAIYYAYMLGLYKIGRFASAAAVYKQYLMTLMQFRDFYAIPAADAKDQFRIPDRKQLTQQVNAGEQ